MTAAAAQARSKSATPDGTRVNSVLAEAAANRTDDDAAGWFYIDNDDRRQGESVVFGPIHMASRPLSPPPPLPTARCQRRSRCFIHPLCITPFACGSSSLTMALTMALSKTARTGPFGVDQIRKWYQAGFVKNGTRVGEIRLMCCTPRSLSLSALCLSPVSFSTPAAEQRILREFEFESVNQIEQNFDEAQFGEDIMTNPTLNHFCRTVP